MKIDASLAAVDKLLKRTIESEPIVNDLYSHVFQVSGKQLRAKLCLISSLNESNHEKFDGNFEEIRVQLATIIELLHSATLVHDDVIDLASQRRGQETVSEAWSNSHAVLIGDYIYSRAFVLMAQIGVPEIIDELADATNKIAQGELIQLQNKKNWNIDIKVLQKINYYKTGRLFEAATKTGSIISERSKKDANLLTHISTSLGIAFQIQDDLLDYGLSNIDIGKPKLQDIKEQKITLPLMFALEESSNQTKKDIKNLLNSKEVVAEKIYDFVLSTSAVKKCNQLLDHNFKTTQELIRNISDNYISSEMLNLLDEVWKRDY